MKTSRKPGYDWTACLLSLVAAFAVAIPLGLLAYRLTNSAGLMTSVFTLAGMGVSTLVYRRVARPGAKRIDSGL